MFSKHEIFIHEYEIFFKKIIFLNITVFNLFKSLCNVSEMYQFAAWHQMASSTFNGMTFDCNDLGQ